MVGGYRVITLCGSTRFKDAFMEVQKQLTLDGNIVISVGLFGHSGDNEVWEGMDEDTLTKTKLMLDDMHKRKIDMSDGIYVINVGGYIGDSTRSEIEYAKRTGKDIQYLEEPISEDELPEDAIDVSEIPMHTQRSPLSLSIKKIFHTYTHQMYKHMKFSKSKSMNTISIKSFYRTL